MIQKMTIPIRAKIISPYYNVRIKIIGWLIMQLARLCSLKVEMIVGKPH